MLAVALLAASLPALTNAGIIGSTKAKRDVPYGTIIDHCTVPGTVALTFDDGPYQYTGHVLDLLDKYGAKATFFVVGDNLGRGLIDDPATPWPDTIRRMVNSGHQVGSHTWDHTDLSTVDTATRQSEIQRVAQAMNNVLGFHPTYMRPPYASCDAACQADMGALGYHVIDFDVDTKDYENDSPDLIHVSMEKYAAAINNGDPATSSFIVLSHDIHENTANTLVEYELQTLQQRGFRAVTVGECLGDAAANWYGTSL